MAWCGTVLCGWESKRLHWGVSSTRVDSQVVSVSSVQVTYLSPSDYGNDGFNKVLSIFWYWFSSAFLDLDVFGSYF